MGIGVGSGVAVGTRVGSAVAVGTWVGVGVGVGAGVGVSVAEMVGNEVGNWVGNGIGEGRAVEVGRSGVTEFVGDVEGLSVVVGALVGPGTKLKGTLVLVGGNMVVLITDSPTEDPWSVQDRAKVSTNAIKTTQKDFRLI